jgi:DNA-binding NtrC family response regulator
MRTRCILLVDRDDRLRALICRILRRERFAIIEFAEPEAALAALPSFSGELSAVVSGSHLAALLRGRFPHLPILMTSNGNPFELRPLIRALRALTCAIRQMGVPAAIPSTS